MVVDTSLTGNILIRMIALCFASRKTRVRCLVYSSNFCCVLRKEICYKLLNDVAILTGNGGYASNRKQHSGPYDHMKKKKNLFYHGTTSKLTLKSFSQTFWFYSNCLLRPKMKNQGSRQSPSLRMEGTELKIKKRLEKRNPSPKTKCNQ